MLPFGFEAKPALVTHQCFDYCRTVLAWCWGFLHCSVYPSVSSLVWGRSQEGTQPGQLIWTDQRDIPYCMSWAQRWIWGILFVQVAIAWGLAGILLSVGNGEWWSLQHLWIFLFFLPRCLTWNFLTFASLILSYILPWQELNSCLGA